MPVGRAERVVGRSGAQLHVRDPDPAGLKQQDQEQERADCDRGATASHDREPNQPPRDRSSRISRTVDWWPQTSRSGSECQVARQIAQAHLTGVPGGAMTAPSMMPAMPMLPGMPGAGPSPTEDKAPGPVGDPAVGPAERAAADEALRLADLWLEPESALPSGVHATAAWTRSEWLDQTLDVWRKLCDPVAERIVGAMGELVPEEMRSQLGPMTSMVASLGGALFGGQLGTALGSLAAAVLSAGDIGLPLGPAGTAALVPANIAEYGKGLELPEDQVRLYVALREAAHQRLFGHVPWR